MKIKASILENSALVSFKPASLKFHVELSYSEPLWQLGF